MATVASTHRVVIMPQAAQLLGTVAGAYATFRTALATYAFVGTDQTQVDDPDFGTVVYERHDIILSSGQDTTLQGTFAAINTQLAAAGLPLLSTWVDVAQVTYAF